MRRLRSQLSTSQAPRRGELTAFSMNLSDAELTGVAIERACCMTVREQIIESRIGPYDAAIAKERDRGLHGRSVVFFLLWVFAALVGTGLAGHHLHDSGYGGGVVAAGVLAVLAGACAGLGVCLAAMRPVYERERRTKWSAQERQRITAALAQGWKLDRTGRYPERWWTGSEWTHTVRIQSWRDYTAIDNVLEDPDPLPLVDPMGYSLSYEG